MSNVNIGKADPESYQALFVLHTQVENSAKASGLDVRLIELIKIRASQLNGCAFCLRMHTTAAIKAGESVDRLAVLPAWWESQYFTQRERAALQLAESVTLVSDCARVPGRGIDPYDILTDAEAAAVTWLTIVINSWNRVAVFSHYPVAP